MCLKFAGTTLWFLQSGVTVNEKELRNIVSKEQDESVFSNCKMKISKKKNENN